MQNTALEYSQFSREELMRVVEAACPDFRLVPKESQWVVALHAAGQTVEAVSALTGQSQAAVKRIVDRYGSATNMLPDSTRMWMSFRLLWTAVSAYTMRVVDRSQIDEMGAMNALAMLQKLPVVMKSLLAIWRESLEAEKEMNESIGLDEFRRQLGEGGKV